MSVWTSQFYPNLLFSQAVVKTGIFPPSKLNKSAAAGLANHSMKNSKSRSSKKIGPHAKPSQGLLHKSTHWTQPTRQWKGKVAPNKRQSICMKILMKFASANKATSPLTWPLASCRVRLLFQTIRWRASLNRWHQNIGWQRSTWSTKLSSSWMGSRVWRKSKIIETAYCWMKSRRFAALRTEFPKRWAIFLMRLLFVTQSTCTRRTWMLLCKSKRYRASQTLIILRTNK